MVFTDHQVRQFYVIDEASKAVSNPEADAVVSNHKFYVKYKDPSGKYITTDKIDSGCIRDIRITSQPGFTPKVWKIYPSKTNVTDTYVLHMLFRNAFGGGVSDFFIKDPAVLAVNGDSVDNLVTKLYDAIELAFRNMGDVTTDNPSVPFYITKDTSNHCLVITEATSAYNRDSTIRGMYPLSLDLDIHCGYKGNSNNPWGLVNTYSGTTAITALKDYQAEGLSANDYFYYEGTLYKATGSSTQGDVPATLSAVANVKEYNKGIATDETVAAVTGATAYAANTAYSLGSYIKNDGKYYKVTTAITTSVNGSSATFSDINSYVTEVTIHPNGPMIAEMEYFFSKGRADLYGYMGFPDVNPSEMKANPSKHYYILDIKYFYQEAGVNNQNSEKELSIASTNKSYLENLITAAHTGEATTCSIVEDDDSVTAGIQGTTLQGGRYVEIFTPKKY